MGHEMGHYVLNHAFKGLVLNGVVIVIAFAFLDWGLLRRTGALGRKWESGESHERPLLPLAYCRRPLFPFPTPLGNTITRTMEYEADMYGLNAAGSPMAKPTSN